MAPPTALAAAPAVATVVALVVALVDDELTGTPLVGTVTEVDGPVVVVVVAVDSPAGGLVGVPCVVLGPPTLGPVPVPVSPPVPGAVVCGVLGPVPVSPPPPPPLVVVGQMVVSVVITTVVGTSVQLPQEPEVVVGAFDRPDVDAVYVGVQTSVGRVNVPLALPEPP